MQQEKYRCVGVTIYWIVIASGSAFDVLACSTATFTHIQISELEYSSDT